MSVAYFQAHFRLDFIMEANNMNPDDKRADRVRTEMGKQNSRTFPGLYSFFKESISSQICMKCEKMHFFSRKHQNEKSHSISLILTSVIKTRTTAQIE